MLAAQISSLGKGTGETLRTASVKALCSELSPGMCQLLIHTAATSHFNPPLQDAGTAALKMHNTVFTSLKTQHRRPPLTTGQNRHGVESTDFNTVLGRLSIHLPFSGFHHSNIFLAAPFLKTDKSPSSTQGLCKLCF